MTKKLVGLFASVALMSSGLALANDKDKNKDQHTQSSQQMGGDAYGGAGSQQGQMGGSQQGHMGGSAMGGSQQMGEKQVTGTVVKSSSDKLSLRTDNGIIDFKVNKSTKFQDPTVKRVRDLKEGQQVRASFDIQGSDNVAKSISLDTNMGGSGMGSDKGINQPADTGGSGLDQGINQDNNLGGSGDMGGSGNVGGSSGSGNVGGSGNLGGSGQKGDKSY